MRRRSLTIVLVGVVLGIGGLATPALACPFCSAVSQTFSEEITAMDVVAIAHLKQPPPPVEPGAESDDFSSQEVATARFEIVKVLKGADVLAGQKVIDTVYFGDGKKGDVFLVMGVDPPKLMWSTPLQLSEKAQEYLPKLLTLPKEGPDRLAFFQDYLEASDEMLARDAYDEFANAPYADVQGLKDRMRRDELVAWIQDRDIPASRKRLYFTMLGVCGSEKDLPLLESMMRSDDRQVKAGLDAMIACYITLAGEKAMPLVEELFLANKDAEYADTYAAIMAIRFHGTETDVVPQKRLVKSLRHMLDRPQLADLVIPDLARWEDWESMPRLVELFKNADEKSSWVRVPVVNYLRACPLPEAKEKMAELEKIDPAAVRRANTFFPFLPSSGGNAEEKSSDDTSDPPAAAEPPAAETGLIYPTPTEESADETPEKSANHSVLAGVSIVTFLGLSIAIWATRK
jgi:hypothetical protein